MVIDAKYFAKIDGTVFAVIHTGAWQCDGVFKTQKAANKLRDTIRASGGTAEVRVGHFEGDKIVTI